MGRTRRRRGDARGAEKSLARGHLDLVPSVKLGHHTLPSDRVGAAVIVRERSDRKERRELLGRPGSYCNGRAAIRMAAIGNSTSVNRATRRSQISEALTQHWLCGPIHADDRQSRISPTCQEVEALGTRVAGIQTVGPLRRGLAFGPRGFAPFGAQRVAAAVRVDRTRNTGAVHPSRPSTNGRSPDRPLALGAPRVGPHFDRVALMDMRAQLMLHPPTGRAPASGALSDRRGRASRPEHHKPRSCGFPFRLLTSEEDP